MLVLLWMKKRLERIRISDVPKISILEKYGYTEQMAFDLCKKYDLLSPIYDFAPRGGCWFCPNARDCELRHLRNNHREYWNTLLWLEMQPNLIGDKWNTLTQKSIHDKEEQFMWEDRQMDIFDFIDTCPEPKTENPYPETKFGQVFEVVNNPVICCTNCLCQYCTHNAEELYRTVKLKEAAPESCFNCDECRIYGGDFKLRNRQKLDCAEFIMSDYGAKRNQRRIKLM